jgi:hypothetical protein
MEAMRRLRKLPSPYEQFLAFKEQRRLNAPDPAVQQRASQLDAQDKETSKPVFTQAQRNWILNQAKSRIDSGHPKEQVYQYVKDKFHMDDGDMPAWLKP